MTSFHRVIPFYWDETTIPNLSHYKLYAGRATGTYDATGSPKNMGSGTSGTFTTDANGVWYFAMTTVDTEAEESEFSQEYVADIPRPSGLIG
jgi:hypothetical protein